MRQGVTEMTTASIGPNDFHLRIRRPAHPQPPHPPSLPYRTFSSPVVLSALFPFQLWSSFSQTHTTPPSTPHAHTLGLCLLQLTYIEIQGETRNQCRLTECRPSLKSCVRPGRHPRASKLESTVLSLCSSCCAGHFRKDRFPPRRVRIMNLNFNVKTKQN